MRIRLIVVGPHEMSVILEATGVARPTKHMKAVQRQAFFRFGEEFHSVAVKAGSPLVRAYLLGQAVELYLKAFLLARGVAVADVKDKYRHNLVRLLDAGEANGITDHVRVSVEIKADIASINALYATKALQYFSLIHVFNNPALPNLARLFRFAKGLRKVLPTVIA